MKPRPPRVPRVTVASGPIGLLSIAPTASLARIVPVGRYGAWNARSGFTHQNLAPLHVQLALWEHTQPLLLLQTALNVLLGSFRDPSVNPHAATARWVSSPLRSNLRAVRNAIVASIQICQQRPV